MTKTKKKKANEDFKKTKLKVGKKLKKTNTTDTTVKARKLVLVSQLKETTTGSSSGGKSDEPVTKRKQTVEDICRQLGHYSKSVRREALIGLKQLVASRPDVLHSHLRALTPALARLISDNTNTDSTSACLRALLQQICRLPPDLLRPHFPLLVTHVLRALSHMEIGVRSLALSVLSQLLQSHAAFCRANSDVFLCFVKLLASAKRPPWNAPHFLDTIAHFIKAHLISTSSEVTQIEINLNFSNGALSKPINLLQIHQKSYPFDVPVLSTVSSALSPLESTANLLALSQSLTSILAASILDDTSGSFLDSTLVIIRLCGRATETCKRGVAEEADFKKKLKSHWDVVLKAAEKRKSKRIGETVEWIRHLNREQSGGKAIKGKPIK